MRKILVGDKNCAGARDARKRPIVAEFAKTQPTEAWNSALLNSCESSYSEFEFLRFSYATLTT